MAVQVLGKVAYFNKGAYNSETNYEINDVVSYNGSSYVSLNDNNQGNLPTNTNYWSVVAEKGDKGDTGKPFVIEKTYSTIESMVADYDNMNVNDYVMIQGSIEEQENATLWTKREVEVSPYKWAYLADFSGASGITGATPNIHIGNVTEGNEPSVTRRSGSSNENPILDFVLKTGAKGDTGATGNGISSIEKTSTSGLVDTYTITFTNGTSTTIEVTNGRGIVSIAKTSSVDYVDTYTITYNDGTTSTFEVANSEVTEEEFDDVVDELNYLYDDLPKVEGEGTNLTLDNTRKGKMSNVLGGNTSQYTTTGKNLFNPSVATLDCSVSGGLITITSNTTDVYIQGTYAYSEANKFLTLEAGSYYLKSTNPNVRVTFYGTNTIDTENNQPVTFNSTADFGGIRIRSSSSLQNVTFGIMLATTNDSFEPYTGQNPSPSPDYPQEVNVISGGNTIRIESKNLFNPTYEVEKQYDAYGNERAMVYYSLNNNGISASRSNNTYGSCFFNKLYLEAGTYTFSLNMSQSNNTTTNARVRIRNFDTLTDFVATYVVVTSNKWSCTFTLTKPTTIGIMTLPSHDTDGTLYLSNIQLEKGNEVTDFYPYVSQSYPINLGTMELCKIGDYQDSIKKSTGKNLFDKDNDITANTGLTSQGGTFSSNDYCMKSWLELKANTQYTLSDNNNTKTKRICFYSDKTESSFINVVEQGKESITFTTPANCKYVRIQIKQTELNYEMLNEGSTALPYEPFGKGKWYKHSEIGKVVLDGSENWALGTTKEITQIFQVSMQSVITDRLTTNNDFYSNYFINQEGDTEKIAFSTNYLYIAINKETASSVADFKTWLSTHNTSVYYVLATPTNTEITDQTLIAQLDNFEKALSYNTQTNISQENNDLPFIISASAFMSLKYLFGNLETRVAELEG